MTVMLFLVKKLSGEKKKCEAVRCCFVAKVQFEVFSHFHTVAVEHHSSLCNGLACQDEFFVNIPHDVKENDEHALNFVLHLSRLFQSL
jgi:hypothetical protein